MVGFVVLIVDRERAGREEGREHFGPSVFRLFTTALQFISTASPTWVAKDQRRAPAAALGDTTVAYPATEKDTNYIVGQKRYARRSAPGKRQGMILSRVSNCACGTLPSAIPRDARVPGWRGGECSRACPSDSPFVALCCRPMAPKVFRPPMLIFSTSTVSRSLIALGLDWPRFHSNRCDQAITAFCPGWWQQIL